MTLKPNLSDQVANFWLKHRLRVIQLLVVVTCLTSSRGIFGATADLSLRVSATPSPVVVGNSLTLSYTILNKGPDTATGIILSNPLPATLIYAGAVVTNGTGTFSNQLFAYSLDTLPASAEVTVAIQVTPMSTETISNRTSVIANESDPWLLDNVNQYGLIQVLAVAPGAQLNLGRQYHTATLLDDGRVLITGGDIWRMPDRVTKTAELYDPRLEVFTFTGDMTDARLWHTATRLPDGTVLVVGGLPDYFVSPVSSVDVYDPAQNAFRPTSPLVTPRAQHTATLLPDGRVLIAGGAPGVTSVEFYDYKTGTMSEGGNLMIPRSGHIAALLPSGQVLFAGGTTDAPPAEIFDPTTGTSKPAGTLTTNRVNNAGVSLADGRVFLMNNAASEIYDPATDEFIPSGKPLSWQYSPSLALLSDGRVLVSGGTSPVGYAQTVQIFDPLAGTFSPGSAMTGPRIYHTATRLQDGRVLLAAGFNASVLNTSEIYVLMFDMDQDGMDDAWELKYGLNPADRTDALQDADGDGFTNLQEYLAGTNPRDPLSLLRIETIQINSNMCRIRFTSAPGKYYRLERTTDYASQNWVTVSNNIPGNGTMLEVLDPVISASRAQWYRVAVLR